MQNQLARLTECLVQRGVNSQGLHGRSQRSGDAGDPGSDDGDVSSMSDGRFVCPLFCFQPAYHAVSIWKMLPCAGLGDR